MTPPRHEQSDLPLADPCALAQALCDIESVSGHEDALAEALWRQLAELPGLRLIREGNAIAARTERGLSERVILAGHLDTVPVAGNLPSRVETVDGEAHLVGRGAADMKGGLAVLLSLAGHAGGGGQLNRDVTWVFYDNEEVDYDLSGLGRLIDRHPDWFEADLAVLGEPTNGGIEGGCNGTLRAVITLRGTAAHSARAWLGHNAIHDAAPILAALAAHTPATVEVDSLAYRESLNAVMIEGGTAGNVIPDLCRVTLNYRFAPDKTVRQAVAALRAVLPAGTDFELTDAAAAARPGLDQPAAAELAAIAHFFTGREPVAKQGWTDVARLAALGIPALNLGPGDPGLAHRDDERCPLPQIEQVHAIVRRWLGADASAM